MDSDEDILDLNGLDEFEDVFDGLTIDTTNTRTVRFETIIEENDDLLDELPPDALQRELQPLSQPIPLQPLLLSETKQLNSSAESIASDIQGWKHKQGSFRLLLETRKKEKRESQERALKDMKIVQQDSAVSMCEDVGPSFVGKRNDLGLLEQPSSLTLQPTQHFSVPTLNTEETSLNSSLSPSIQTTPRKMQSRLRPPTPSIKNKLAYTPFDKSRTPSVHPTNISLHSRDHSDVSEKVESPLRAIGRKYAGQEGRESVKYRRIEPTSEDGSMYISIFLIVDAKLGRVGVTPLKIAVRQSPSLTPIKPVSLKRLDEMRLKYARK